METLALSAGVHPPLEGEGRWRAKHDSGVGWKPSPKTKLGETRCAGHPTPIISLRELIDPPPPGESEKSGPQRTRIGEGNRGTCFRYA
jgi:hypothetical protein